jgi:surface antigen
MSSGETAGTGLGAAGGGLIGYAISGSPAGVIIGMAAGGLIGNRLSNALDGDSSSAAGQAAARAAEASTGTTITWRKTNALFQTEASGTATAQGALFTDSTGKTCRYIRETAVQNGKMTEDTVKLCKSPQGWMAGVG